MIPNAVTISPWRYVLPPGLVITGAEFTGRFHLNDASRLQRATGGCALQAPPAPSVTTTSPAAAGKTSTKKRRRSPTGFPVASTLDTVAFVSWRSPVVNPLTSSPKSNWSRNFGTAGPVIAVMVTSMVLLVCAAAGGAPDAKVSSASAPAESAAGGRDVRRADGAGNRAVVMTATIVAAAPPAANGGRRPKNR